MFQTDIFHFIIFPPQPDRSGLERLARKDSSHEILEDAARETLSHLKQIQKTVAELETRTNNLVTVEIVRQVVREEFQSFLHDSYRSRNVLGVLPEMPYKAGQSVIPPTSERMDTHTDTEPMEAKRESATHQRKADSPPLVGMEKESLQLGVAGGMLSLSTDGRRTWDTNERETSLSKSTLSSSSSSPQRQPNVSPRLSRPYDWSDSLNLASSEGLGSAPFKPERQSLTQSLQARKETIINKTLDQVTAWLDRRFAMTQNGPESSAPDAASSTRGSGDSNTQGSGPSRKRKLEQREGGENPDDENDLPDGRHPKRWSGIEDDDKWFACPFFKNNPVKYNKHRLCCGPGWDSVHRVK